MKHQRKTGYCLSITLDFLSHSAVFGLSTTTTTAFRKSIKKHPKGWGLFAILQVAVVVGVSVFVAGSIAGASSEAGLPSYYYYYGFRTLKWSDCVH